MSTFGFYPGPIDYWMLVTDWRGGSIAIMLVIGALIIGYAFRYYRQPLFSPPMRVLPSPRVRLMRAILGNRDALPLCRKRPFALSPFRARQKRPYVGRLAFMARKAGR